MNHLLSHVQASWPENLLLHIFEEENWDVLKKKLPADYHGTLEYLLLTYFGENPTKIIRMVFQDNKSVDDIAKILNMDLEMTCRIIMAQIKRLKMPYYTRQILLGISGIMIREQAFSEQKGLYEGYHDGYKAALEDARKAEEDKYAEVSCNPAFPSPVNLKSYLSDLCLPLRLHNRLLRAGYKKIEDLQCMPFEYMMAITGIEYEDGCVIAKAIREAGHNYQGGKEEPNE